MDILTMRLNQSLQDQQVGVCEREIEVEIERVNMVCVCACVCGLESR
ncbi:hypothetical protein BH23THE1_BH23THE1_07020 [soil metagenome]